jgi:hypothetical protein
MQPDYEIELGRGIGNILFGIYKEELSDILGEPNDIEIPEDPETDNRECYQYDSINCSFSFDPDYEERLVEISIENPCFHILNKIRVGVSKAEILNLGESLKFGECKIEDMRNEELPDHELISYHLVGLNLWLTNGIVSAIQISPVFTKEDEITWPE